MLVALTDVLHVVCLHINSHTDIEQHGYTTVLYNFTVFGDVGKGLFSWSKSMGSLLPHAPSHCFPKHPSTGGTLSPTTVNYKDTINHVSKFYWYNNYTYLE